MASEIGEKILKFLESHDAGIDTLKLAEIWNEDHQKIVGAVKSLQSLGDVIEAELTSKAYWVLTDEGKLVLDSGSHEALVYNAVPPEGIAQAEIMAKVPNAKIGFSKAMSSGWIAVDKSGSGGPKVVRKVDSIVDVVQQHLKNLVADQGSLENALKQEYKKRKLVQEVIIKSYILKPGPSFSTSVSKQETELTPEMIASGSWKTKEFKTYNLDALGTPVPRGHLHPLMKVRAEFRQIFLEMGFTEMPTNNYVESSFWNFDALFQPQQHPARDAHDTFFISDPASCGDIPQDYMERVKKVHSVGGYGSTGYGYDWKIEEAQKNILRTHTTAVSARMLYSLAQNGFKPVKYFSIDRVFRNETLDATHLAEFHQIEGVIADYGITLGHLIGTLYEFFRKLGIEKLRFKPAYNPYTEPSMEVFSYHPGLGKWVEVGNSGVFRPELLLPMGIPEGVSVIAWGLSLERPTMIKYGVDNIRDLVGPKVNLQMVADNPLCRLDKHRPKAANEPEDLQKLETQIESIIKKLEEVQKGVSALKRSQRSNDPLTVVIEADPAHAPKSLRSVIKQMNGIDTLLTVHNHSSLPLPNRCQDWISPIGSSVSRLNSQLNITWIWKPVGSQPILKFVNRPESADLRGEASIARLLARLVESSTGSIIYESAGGQLAARIDQWIDLKESTDDLNSIHRKAEQRLGKADWLVGDGRGIKTLADIFLSSILDDSTGKEPLKKWIQRSS